MLVCDHFQKDPVAPDDFAIEALLNRHYECSGQIDVEQYVERSAVALGRLLSTLLVRGDLQLDDFAFILNAPSLRIVE